MKIFTIFNVFFMGMILRLGHTGHNELRFKVVMAQINIMNTRIHDMHYNLLLVIQHGIIYNEMDGWMNGVLGHFFALSRLNWAGDNLD